jgi:hypothetical protein
MHSPACVAASVVNAKTFLHNYDFYDIERKTFSLLNFLMQAFVARQLINKSRSLDFGGEVKK